MKGIVAFYRFSRPHTILGTTFSIVSLYLIAFANSDHGSLHLDALFLTLLSCLAANIYIVGLNQITDVAIDRINKPYLPLASGAFTMRTGNILVILSLILAIVVAIYSGPYLLLTVCISLFIGTIYSLPPVRLKRFHLWAAASIFVVRGIVVNLFLYLHFITILTGVPHIHFSVWVLTLFMLWLSLAIAWFKDIPDMAGDKEFNIMSLSLKWGSVKVFRIGNVLLSLGYLSLIALALRGIPDINNTFFLLCNAVLFLTMLIMAHRVALENKASVTRYYLFIWLLFFCNYILFAAASLLNEYLPES